MAISTEVRLLATAWKSGTKWPQRLESLTIRGIRGWSGQKINFDFPIVALVGENGSGKTTVLQAAASVYNSNKMFASDYFPDTPFDEITGASIDYSFKQGSSSISKSIRKPTNRWLGNPDRPKRAVSYIDLNRIQPIPARTGFSNLLKKGIEGEIHKQFDAKDTERLGRIIGKAYAGANISFVKADPKRLVPVLSLGEKITYSGFHQGAGELTAAELLAQDLPKYGLILIDEIETSLHPRAQRRLLRDLAAIAREKELQIVLTTHSPYILEELPPEARIYLMQGSSGRTIVTGVSPEYAMTQMDEDKVPECDIYVEDRRAATWVSQALAIGARDHARRVQLIPFGGSQVGVSLGMMKEKRLFPRRSIVFLDGNEPEAIGTLKLPGGDAPERVVFRDLKTAGWPGLGKRLSRSPSETIDALEAAMQLSDEHRWPSEAADRLDLGADALWHTLCTVWAEIDAHAADLGLIVNPIRDSIELPYEQAK